MADPGIIERGAQPEMIEMGGAAAHVSAESAKPRVSLQKKRYSADIRGGGGARRAPPKSANDF